MVSVFLNVNVHYYNMAWIICKSKKYARLFHISSFLKPSCPPISYFHSANMNHPKSQSSLSHYQIHQPARICTYLHHGFSFQSSQPPLWSKDHPFIGPWHLNSNSLFCTIIYHDTNLVGVKPCWLNWINRFASRQISDYSKNKSISWN